MGDSEPEVVRQNNWLIMVDPAWGSTAESPPPVENIVGGWMVNEDGSTEPFRPNPKYRPDSESTPSDPIDAILRRVASGAQRLGDELVPRIRDSVVEVGCDGHNQPLIGTAPDGARCIVVATAELQKVGVDVDRWWPIHGAELAEIVPPGVDIFLNAAGRAPFKLAADALKRGQ